MPLPEYTYRPKLEELWLSCLLGAPTVSHQVFAKTFSSLLCSQNRSFLSTSTNIQQGSMEVRLSSCRLKALFIPDQVNIGTSKSKLKGREESRIPSTLELWRLYMNLLLL